MVIHTMMRCNMRFDTFPEIIVANDDIVLTPSSYSKADGRCSVVKKQQTRLGMQQG
jgi:hypothetical protein